MLLPYKRKWIISVWASYFYYIFIIIILYTDNFLCFMLLLTGPVLFGTFWMPMVYVGYLQSCILSFFYLTCCNFCCFIIRLAHLSLYMADTCVFKRSCGVAKKKKKIPCSPAFFFFSSDLLHLLLFYYTTCSFRPTLVFLKDTSCRVGQVA